MNTSRALVLILIQLIISSLGYAVTGAHVPFPLWIEYVDALDRAGKTREGLDELHKLFREYPGLHRDEHFEALWRQGRLMAHAGEWEAADAPFRQAHTLLPFAREPELFQAEYADFLRTRKSYHEADALYSDLIQKQPNALRPRLERARMLFWAQEYNRSLCAYGETYGLSPEDAAKLREEGRIKEALYARKPFCALILANRLLDHDPDNQEVRFDRAQIRYGLGCFCASLSDYEWLVNREPNHEEALRLRGYLRARSGCRTESYFDGGMKKGRGELKHVGWWGSKNVVDIPCPGHQRDWRLEGGFTHYEPGFAPSVDSVYGAVTYFQQLNLATALESRLQINEYRNHLPLTVSGHTRIDWHPCDGWGGRAELSREDVLDNRFNFENAVHLHSALLEGWGLFCRSVTGSCRYRMGLTTDGNRLQEGGVALNWEWMPSPCYLAFALHVNWMHSAHGSRYDVQNGVTERIIYPYWTPHHYFEAYAQLHWRHHLFYPLYAGYERLYYDVQIRAGLDDHQQWEAGGQCEWLWACSSCFEIGAQAVVFRSQAYHETRGSALARFWW